MTPRTLQHPPTPPAQRKLTPEMPRIPGLVQTAPRGPRQVKQLITVILAALLCVSGFALWLSHRRHSGHNASVAASGTPIGQVSTSDAPSVTKIDTEPNTIGTLYELAQPWSSKTFLFVDPKTQQGVPAMVIHLPGPPAEPSFWAFALTNPLSRCQLQYVTDLSALSLRFAYPAAHPMVVSDCDGIVYDPLKMATLPNGSWVRGYIVRGGGIRPPISIQVEVRGRDVIAKRIE